ncbi:hypothetical protein ACFOY2_28100 [Nonomuraea purpurea]|uniref:Uncharacterized protein n=1 Tax=Nonomuraea purpurea TaxID=1849276 RepID=A0ABV8GDE5_9ACTN
MATLRGSPNLVFANSRAAVEDYTDLLNRRCEDVRPIRPGAHQSGLVEFRVVGVLQTAVRPDQ